MIIDIEMRKQNINNIVNDLLELLQFKKNNKLTPSDEEIEQSTKIFEKMIKDETLNDDMNNILNKYIHFYNKQFINQLQQKIKIEEKNFSIVPKTSNLIVDLAKNENIPIDKIFDESLIDKAVDQYIKQLSIANNTLIKEFIALHHELIGSLSEGEKLKEEKSLGEEKEDIKEENIEEENVEKKEEVLEEEDLKEKEIDLKEIGSIGEYINKETLQNKLLLLEILYTYHNGLREETIYLFFFTKEMLEELINYFKQATDQLSYYFNKIFTAMKEKIEKEEDKMIYINDLWIHIIFTPFKEEFEEIYERIEDKDLYVKAYRLKNFTIDKQPLKVYKMLTPILVKQYNIIKIHSV